jgi:hypothetical protein
LDGPSCDWPLLADVGEQIANAYLVEVLPESVLVTPDGRVQTVIIGRVSRADLDAAIQKG